MENKGAHHNTRKETLSRETHRESLRAFTTPLLSGFRNNWKLKAEGGADIQSVTFGG